MDREAWWATGQGVAQVGHDFATKPPLKSQKKKTKKKPFLGLNISLEKMICHFDSKTFKTPVSFFL